MINKAKKLNLSVLLAALCVIALISALIPAVSSAKYVIEAEKDVNITIVSATNYIYLDGVNGNDSNDGSTPEKAVKTFKRAFTLIKALPNTVKKAIVICGSITQSSVTSTSAGVFDSDVTITSKNNDYDFTSTATLTISGTWNMYANIVFDNISAAASGTTVLYANGNKLTLGAGFTNTGTITNVYGGGNTAVSGDTELLIEGGTISNVYGGGTKAVSGRAIVNITGGTITNVYGGGTSSSGTVDEAEVTITGGTFGAIYGGGANSAAVSGATGVKLTVKNATVGNIYGGGNGTSATVTQTDLHVENCQVATAIYGGGAGPVTGQAEVNVVNCTSNSALIIYGGVSNSSTVGSTIVSVTNSNAATVYGGSSGTVSGNTYTTISGGNITTVYGGGNNGTVSGTTTVLMTGGNVGTIYGGSNTGTMSASSTNSLKVFVKGGTVGDIYGGCYNKSTAAGSYIDTENCTVTGTIYAGGRSSNVTTDCYLYIRSTTKGADGNVIASSKIKIGKLQNGLIGIGLIGVRYAHIYYEANTSKTFGSQTKLWTSPTRLNP